MADLSNLLLIVSIGLPFFGFFGSISWLYVQINYRLSYATEGAQPSRQEEDRKEKTLPPGDRE